MRVCCVEMAVATRTDPAGPYLTRINDRVDQFRLWGGTEVYSLPIDLSPQERCTIGSGEEASIQLKDPRGRVSRLHAELLLEPTPEGVGWKLIDLGSKNGSFLDGQKLQEFAITPGAEVRIARVTLIAESPRLRELREMYCRILGWSEDRRNEVDIALRSTYRAMTMHEPLFLYADVGHAAIARQIHRIAIGPKRPFIVFERRKRSPEELRSEESRRRARVFESGMEALEAAIGGTLVVNRRRLPADFERVLATVRAGDEGVLLIVTAPAIQRGTHVHIHSEVVVPPLATRASELDRIIDAYAADAINEMGGSFTPEDRKWIASQPKLTLVNIETATRRVLADRLSNSEANPSMDYGGMAQGTMPSRKDELYMSFAATDDDDGDDADYDDDEDDG